MEATKVDAVIMELNVSLNDLELKDGTQSTPTAKRKRRTIKVISCGGGGKCVPYTAANGDTVWLCGC
jgi:hypothetical protein